MSLPRTAAVGTAILVAVTVTVGTAGAQTFVGAGVGVGVGVGPTVGPWYGPGLWGGVGFPVAGGYYGPYARPSLPPVPGTFIGGLSNQQLYNGSYRPGTYDPWLYSPGLGIYGPAKDYPPVVPPPGWDGPRFATRDVRRNYALAKADPAAAYDRAYREFGRASGRPIGRPQLLQPCLRVTVTVPAADTPVSIQGQPMAGTGTDRVFESPPLTPGTEYHYTITATLPDGRTETKTVGGKAGESVSVQFGPAAPRPLPLPAVPPPVPVPEVVPPTAASSGR